MDAAELTNRFAYHAPHGGKVARHEAVRNICLAVALELNDLVPEGREKSLAITHLEDAMMWANAGIARKPDQGPVA
jgi:hypothetical protein